jgi:hypothetical protein
VGVVQAAERLHEDVQPHREAQVVARVRVAEDAVQWLPLEVLHGQEVAPTRVPNLERLNDVGMIEPSCEASLVQEHLDEVWILAELAFEHLDDEQLLKLCRRLDAFGHGEIHVGHAAATDVADQTIPSEHVRHRRFFSRMSRVRVRHTEAQIVRACPRERTSGDGCRDRPMAPPRRSFHAARRALEESVMHTSPHIWLPVD